MDVLKKIKSATLIEALVATVLIVIVFVVSSLILNSLLFNTFSRNTHALENRIFELQYKAYNNSINPPYREEYNNWDIELTIDQSGKMSWLKCTAVNKTNKKEVIKIISNAAH